LNGFYLILPFILRKSSSAPYKKLLKKVARGKKIIVLLWFQKGVKQKGKKCYRLIIFCFFFGGGGVGHFFTQKICTFLKLARNCASFDTISGQFQRIFSTVIRGDATFFWRVKGRIR
jgi:hypothetical protein